MSSFPKRVSQLPHQFWIAFSLGVLYLLTRIASLTILPVFADEAIYIRWAQLLTHDTAYIFFALNDGKPPLFIWSLVPVLPVFSDPLFAARLVSGLIGGITLWVLDRVLLELRASQLARLANAFIVIVAPFWFFHHRMALMDGLLVLGLSLSWWGLLRLDTIPWSDSLLKYLPFLHKEKTWLTGLLLAGGGWGMALWTKTPALFFAPVFLLWAYFTPALWNQKHRKLEWSQIRARSLFFGLAGILGLSIFAILRISPAFGSLFGRGTDFTFTTQELLQGEWRTSLNNIPRVLGWVSTYLRPELLSLPFLAVVFSRQRVFHIRTVLTALIWAAPLVIFGRVLHARYFLPLAPFLTVSGALFFAEAWEIIKKQKDQMYIRLAFFLLILFFWIGSLRFLFFALFSPNMIPFVLDDRSQYLTEWSSGHGLAQVRDLLIEQARKGNRVTVVTEGSFGSLPDGLLLYFDRLPEISHLRIEGLAQYPVKSIPDWVREEAAQHETWLVVNQHRLDMDPEQTGLELIARYPRPYGAPDLQVYRIHPE